MDHGAMQGMDHGAMQGMDHGAMQGMDHGAMQGMDHDSMQGMDHGAMQGMDHGAMQGMDHGAMQGMDHDSMQGMDHGAMQGMDHGAMRGMDHDSMRGMDHGAMQGMDHGSMRETDHGSMRNMDHDPTPGKSTGMEMGPMQGGSPPADARDPDYSAGVGLGPSHGLDMAMEDNPRLTKVMLNQLEAFHGKDSSGQRWEAEGWYGNDYDKLWLRTEGERTGGALESGDLEVLWSHAVASFWNTQSGVRADAGRGPDRTWAAFGIQGLAPYWFETEATGYVGPAGRTAARVRIEYELLLTQRLILQPELEANLYGRSDPARRLGAGLSDAEFGLRLRYEIRREFAPYIGVVWTRRFGGTADFARAEGEGIFDRQWVAGFRIWF
ncbi:copper resistance protein B [Frateuria soli]|uniref:copper resistance protein B n=1 Tax=Frateuria soli TaxID=1542730 RepID=UPI001E452ACD|nr:copper resistance protein B [Frateuria soli]UGB39535.1 copper resistance protein B [Frateuria soli]